MVPQTKGHWHFRPAKCQMGTRICSSNLAPLYLAEAIGRPKFEWMSKVGGGEKSFKFLIIFQKSHFYFKENLILFSWKISLRNCRPAGNFGKRNGRAKAISSWWTNLTWVCQTLLTQGNWTRNSKTRNFCTGSKIGYFKVCLNAKTKNHQKIQSVF